MKVLGFLLFLLSFTLDVANGNSGNIVNSAIIESQALKGVPVVTRPLQGTVSPIIVEDDLAVLDASGSLYLLDRNNLSDLKWKLNLTTKGYIRASLLYQDNYIFCTIENSIYKIDPKKGEIIWNRELKAPVRSKVAMLNCTLIAITIDNYLYAINVKDGSLIWIYQGSQIELTKLSSASPVEKDNIVVVPFSSGNVVAFSEYGEKLWEYKLPSSAEFLDYPFIDVITALRVQGEKVIVTNRFSIFALNLSSGDKIWSKTLNVKAISKATENSIFIITNDNKIKGMNLQDGYSIWTLDLSNTIKINNATYFSEPIFADNKLFITTNQGALIELNPSNGMIEKVISIPKGVYTTLVFSDSYFYIITIGNGLFKMRNVYE